MRFTTKIVINYCYDFKYNVIIRYKMYYYIQQLCIIFTIMYKYYNIIY